VSSPHQAVFLSYASQDVDAARRICDALLSAGIEVWFDQSELRGGDAWDAAIRKQVRECALFMPLISANTEARSEGYFRREWNLAVHRMMDMADDQAFLLPVVIDSTPNASARVPDRFRERQWIRLPDGGTPAGFVERVMRLLSGSPAKSAPVLQPEQPASKSVAVSTQEGFWVAVLPFKHGGANPDTAALAEGLSDAIVTGMSRFPYLRVIARSSTLKYSGEADDVRSIGKELGARYVIEGSVRQAGGAVRIAVQLIDAGSGAQLWAETFDRPFSPESVFELQDALAHRIVSTVADAHGVLLHTLSEALRSRNHEELSPYEAVLRSFGFWERLTADEFATTLASLERAVQQAPGFSYAWAALSLILGTQHYYGFDGQPDPLGRALQAARKAVDLDPSSHRAHQALAETLYWRKEMQAFRPAAERAIALNPMDGCAVASIGGLMAYSGDWERGCALVQRVVALNPHHPGWYWFPVYMNAYRKGDYRGALEVALRIDIPGSYDTHVALAAAHGQLGEREAGGKSIRDLLALAPGFALSARADLGKWLHPELVEHLIDGLRKAGLEIGPANTSSREEFRR
jgi:TolB-like protein